MGQVSSVGLDLAKSIFQAHGADASGEGVFRKKLGRGRLLAFFAGLAPCVVAMEACAGAHHWGRELTRQGHTVRLIPPIYVKPFVSVRRTTWLMRSPAFQDAVAGDLVMLHCLSGSQQTGVQRGVVLVFLDDLVALGQDAFNGVTGLAARRLADQFEHLLYAFNLAFGLVPVLLKSCLQFRRLRGARPMLVIARYWTAASDTADIANYAACMMPYVVQMVETNCSAGKI